MEIEGRIKAINANFIPQGGTVYNFRFTIFTKRKTKFTKRFLNLLFFLSVVREFCG